MAALNLPLILLKRPQLFSEGRHVLSPIRQQRSKIHVRGYLLQYQHTNQPEESILDFQGTFTGIFPILRSSCLRGFCPVEESLEFIQKNSNTNSCSAGLISVCWRRKYTDFRQYYVKLLGFYSSSRQLRSRIVQNISGLVPPPEPLRLPL